MNANLFPGAVALLLALAAPAPAAAPAGDAAAPGPVFSSLDTDRDGFLSPREFRAGYPALQAAIALEVRLRAQFARLDADGSGRLEADDYARLELVRKAGASAPALATFDTDRDGGLGFGEYVTAVEALTTPPPSPRGGGQPAAAARQER